VTRQNRDRHKLDRQKLEQLERRDKLALVVDNVQSCVKSTQILHVLVHIILGDNLRNFGLALQNSARYRSRVGPSFNGPDFDGPGFVGPGFDREPTAPLGYNSVADNTGLFSFFIPLAAVSSKVCQIPRNSRRIRTFCRTWSSKVIDLGVNRKRICDFLLVINCNFGHIYYRFQDIDENG